MSDPDLVVDDRYPLPRRLWRAVAPTGERYLVCVAPRGSFLYLPESTDLISDLTEAVYTTFRENGTWKVGVFRSESLRAKRRVYRKVGLTEEAAIEEAAGLRARILRGYLP